MRNTAIGVLVLVLVIVLLISTVSVLAIKVDTLLAERVSSNHALWEAEALISILEIEKGNAEQKIENFQVNGYRPWESVNEVRRWLYNDDTSEGEYTKKFNDCDDFMIDLIEAARIDGRLIGALIVENGDYVHARNYVIVGNEVWAVEPQNDRVELMGRVD